MTNDLMRDYLDGRIHVRKPFKPGIYLGPAGKSLTLDDATGWTNVTGYISIDGYGGHVAELHVPPPPTTQPPTDPRERALWAKQQRGTGPSVGALKERGRVTKYQTKG